MRICKLVDLNVYVEGYWMEFVAGMGQEGWEALYLVGNLAGLPAHWD